MGSFKHQNLLVDNSIESIKKRLITTLGNIEFQKGQVFWDDIEKLKHCIMALENIEIANKKIFERQLINKDNEDLPVFDLYTNDLNK